MPDTRHLIVDTVDQGQAKTHVRLLTITLGIIIETR